MATQLSRTFGSQGNQRKFTISTWVKRNKLGTSQSFFGSGGATNYSTALYFRGSDDTIVFYNYFNGAYAGQKYSSAVFRDTSAWYHIVFRVDTTSATASERMRIYVNGEEISYATSNNPSQNQTMEVGHTGTHYIGGYGTGAQAEMCMSHYHYCDGQSYAPTEFGEYDANGVWKIKLEPSVSYGVSGHFLFNNDASVTDQSGLGNNWSVNGGTLTKTEDNPSNVFDTYNPLTIIGTDPTLSNGNTKVSSTTGNHWRTTNSNIGMSSGKYYWETKVGTISMANYCRLGVVSENLISRQTTDKFQGNYAYGINWDGNKLVNSTLSSYTSIATGDIFMFALDLDNNFIYAGKNGTWINSGDPTSGSSGTNALSAVQSGETYFISASIYQSSQETNFGNGYFGTTAVSSAGTNASGIGIFEYDVPTGYTALSTKGLNL